MSYGVKIYSKKSGREYPVDRKSTSELTQQTATLVRFWAVLTAFPRF